MSVAVDAVSRLAVANNSATKERLINAARYIDASPGAVRPGVFPGTGTWVLSYGSPTADTWYVSPGSAVLSDGAGGALEVTNAGTKSEAAPTRPAASTSRYDVIALEPVTSGGSQTATLTRYSGTAGASPSLSTATSQVSANGLIIGYYLLGNSGAPTITNLPQFTTTAGGVLHVRDGADRTALDSSGALFQGIEIFRRDLGYKQVNRTGVAEATTAGSWVTQLALGAPFYKGTVTPGAGLLAGAAIALNTQIDTESGWDSTNSRYVFKWAGLYEIVGQIKGGGTGVSGQYIQFTRTGSSTVGYFSEQFPNLAYGGGRGVWPAQFAVGDTLSFRAGVAQSTQDDSPRENNFLSIKWLRP